MKSELKRIKKYYGEEMMHLCRELFPSIFTPDIISALSSALIKVISDNLIKVLDIKVKY